MIIAMLQWDYFKWSWENLRWRVFFFPCTQVQDAFRCRLRNCQDPINADATGTFPNGHAQIMVRGLNQPGAVSICPLGIWLGKDTVIVFFFLVPSAVTTERRKIPLEMMEVFMRRILRSSSVKCGSNLSELNAQPIINDTLNSFHIILWPPFNLIP